MEGRFDRDSLVDYVIRSEDEPQNLIQILLEGGFEQIGVIESEDCGMNFAINRNQEYNELVKQYPSGHIVTVPALRVIKADKQEYYVSVVLWAEL